MEAIQEFLSSGVLPTVLLILRALVPLLALYVVWRCYTSFKKGQRRRDPVIMLWDEASGARFPVLYWENSIGRSRSCDITLPDAAMSRDHGVLLRRDEGWFICDNRLQVRDLCQPQKGGGPPAGEHRRHHHPGGHHPHPVEHRRRAPQAAARLHRFLPGGRLPPKADAHRLLHPAAGGGPGPVSGRGAPSRAAHPLRRGAGHGLGAVHLLHRHPPPGQLRDRDRSLPPVGAGHPAPLRLRPPGGHHPAGRHAAGGVPLQLPAVVHGGHGPCGQVPSVDRTGGPGAPGPHPGVRLRGLRLQKLDLPGPPQRPALRVCEDLLHLRGHLHLRPPPDQEEHRRVPAVHRGLHRPFGPHARLRHGPHPLRHLPHHRLHAFRQRAHHRPGAGRGGAGRVRDLGRQALCAGPLPGLGPRVGPHQRRVRLPADPHPHLHSQRRPVRAGPGR